MNSITSPNGSTSRTSLGQCLVNGFVSDSENTPAIVRISNIGNNITTLGAVTITAIGAINGVNDSPLSKVADVVPWKAAVSGSLRIWLDVMKPIAELLFFWGVIAAVWIPMIPAVIWIGGIASLLAVWVEAVAAAPIWAFAHLDTDGEGMGQRAQTGYLFILNVLFRPALMVVGFILGSMMVDLLTIYVADIFPTIIANSSSDSWTGIIKLVAYISAFVIILQMVVSLSFGMIRFVPDQVLGWAGGNMVNQVGAHAEDVAGGAAKNAFAARGAVSGAASNATQASEMRQRAANNKANQEAKQARHQSSMSALTNRQATNGQADSMLSATASGKISNEQV